ncbi:putative alpha-N-arabinofuranosidase B [Mycena indigotica]|uniref:Alpha-L-arabinofuranosidase n=1 Tax=Mycena indigotica TaxID=2126181 RepID=A0A8H6T4A3_9AGAR|nr:putative alpha-N-arabinofuranosidase B [Mycena indigotica]KAF7309657.1 putative alpha-N-arabinofuranosidase B [Mycena indigotica]
MFSSLLGLCLVATLVAAGPCDIYSSGGTPCVAAHSTTRALYSSFSSSLYQVKRGSDGATTNIAPLSAGGVANAAAQDSFCSGTTCLITIIYDQSGRGNHLTQAPPGGFNGPESNGADNLASAIGAPVTLNGQKAYGVFVSPGTGYRNDATNGIAKGDAAEGMYAVLDGTHFNGSANHGRAVVLTTAMLRPIIETLLPLGNGHMEAIYFGNNNVWGTGSGNGPWIMADLENGLFSGQGTKLNSGDPTQTSRFITAVVKGQPGLWAIRGGNAASGSLSTYYSGGRPTVGGYSPMSKEGAIILGIGGDNSNGAQGTFYEGVMTTGYPSDATENSVQANIVAAGYATTSLVSGPSISVGSSVSFRVTTPNFNTRYIAHNGTAVNTQVVSSSSSNALKLSASWNVVSGLANSGCISFQSRDTSNSYLRHFNFALQVNSNDGSQTFREDATFCPQAGLNGQGNTIRSWSYPTRFFRHFNNNLFIASNGGVHDFDNTASFNDDISFVVTAAFA